MKQISVKGLAEFMSASPSKQRTIVRRYKYPKEDEARAMRIYYREAKEVVEAHHRRGQGPDWLLEEAARLTTLSDFLEGPSRTRLRHNVRGLRAYAAHFAARPFEILKGVSAPLTFGDVRISVVPDLHVREGKNEKVIKLEFGVEPPSETEVKVISQLMFEAVLVSGLPLPAAGVLYLDVERGKEHRGARAGSRMKRDIEAACKTISDIWDSI